MYTLNDIKFYHATSSYFSVGIELHGLGGQVPPVVTDAVNALAELYDHSMDFLDERINSYGGQFQTQELSMLQKAYICEGHEPKAKWRTYFDQILLSVGCIAPQVNTGHYDYGDTYITPSIYTARRYSQNEFGSESITNLAACIAPAKILGIKVPISDTLNECMQFRHEPIIYSMTGVEIQSIANEHSGHGGAVQEKVDQLLSFFNEYDFEFAEGVCQQMNFRLTQPIHPHRLLVIK